MSRCETPRFWSNRKWNAWTHPSQISFWSIPTIKLFGTTSDCWARNAFGSWFAVQMPAFWMAHSFTYTQVPCHPIQYLLLQNQHPRLRRKFLNFFDPPNCVRSWSWRPVIKLGGSSFLVVVTEPVNKIFVTSTIPVPWKSATVISILDYTVLDTLSKQLRPITTTSSESKLTEHTALSHLTSSLISLMTHFDLLISLMDVLWMLFLHTFCLEMFKKLRSISPLYLLR